MPGFVPGSSGHLKNGYTQIAAAHGRLMYGQVSHSEKPTQPHLNVKHSALLNILLPLLPHSHEKPQNRGAKRAAAPERGKKEKVLVCLSEEEGRARYPTGCHSALHPADIYMLNVYVHLLSVRGSKESGHTKAGPEVIKKKSSQIRNDIIMGDG